MVKQKCIGSANFTYQTRAAVTTIFPEKGSVFGGTIVDIYGTGFVNSSSLTCKFGRLYIAGKFVNSTYMRCRSPARMAGSVLFQVSRIIKLTSRKTKSSSCIWKRRQFYLLCHEVVL